MNVIFTNRGIPIVEIDGYHYDFSRSNYSILVGELALDIDTCNLLKNHVVDKCNEVMAATDLSYDTPASELNTKINSLAELTELYLVNDVVSSAINNHKMLTTPKPYERWVWNQELAAWVAPIEYPSEPGDGVYVWSDDLYSWEPAEPKPHTSWVWNAELNEYVPPVPYPLDAQEGDFIWDESRLSWVLNV